MSGISRPRPAVSSCSWAPGQRIARSADPHALGGVELDTRVSLAHFEHARLHEPLTDAAGQAVDRRADVDRAAELVQERLVLGRLENRKRAGLLLAPHQASRHPGRLERRRALGHVRPTDENALAPEQPRAELVLEPLPLSPRPNRKPDEPLVVMPMPKDPSAPGRLPGPRRGRLEANELNAAPLQRIRRGEPGDPSADDGDLCSRGAHEDRVYRLALESGPRGAVAELANAPVSKTGDSRFESWLPRLHRVIRVRPKGE